MKRTKSTRRLVLLLFLVLFPAAACDAVAVRRDGFVPPVATARPLRIAPYDALHYAIDLELHPAERRIEATCAVRLAAAEEGLETVELDLVGLEATAVRDSAGRALAFLQEDGVLAVTLAEPLARGAEEVLEVDYGGRPKTGLWFVGDDGRAGPTHVFTQGECEDARGWFPCFDHPSDRATSEVRVAMPADWVSIAAGELVGRSEEGGRAVEHWVMDDAHPTYLVTLVAGDLHVRKGSWEDVELWFAAEERYAERLESTFAETGDVLAFLSDYTGLRYPWSKYAQTCVANFPFGGMENITATTMTDLVLVDERGRRDGDATGLIAHEAAHQWFGNLLTCVDWPHIWLNEGFATYMTLLYFEETRGSDEFRARVRDAQDAYVEADVAGNRRPTVSDVYVEPLDLFFAGHTYAGGAARLHNLRLVLGEEDFRAAVRLYVAENAGSGVDTGDFRRAAEKVSGRDLGWWFDQWFHRPGYPEFRVEWEWSERDGLARLAVDQVQRTEDGTPAVFRSPVLVAVREPGGTRVHRLEIDERREVFELPARERPLYVRFDHGGWIPKAVTWTRPPAEWMAIAGEDDDVNGRRDAVRALGELSERAKMTRPHAREIHVATIVERLRGDSSPWVRADAAKALGRAGGMEGRHALMAAASGDPEARVRVAALQGLASFTGDPLVAEFARARFEDRFSWDTMAAAAGLVVAVDSQNAMKWLQPRLRTPSPHDRLRAGLLEHVAELGGDGARDELIFWLADEGTAPSARAAAARGLTKFRTRPVGTAEALGRCLESDSFRLRRAAIEALAEIGGPTAWRILEAEYPRARTPAERRAIEGALARRPPRV